MESFGRGTQITFVLYTEENFNFLIFSLPSFTFPIFFLKPRTSFLPFVLIYCVLIINFMEYFISDVTCAA